MKLSLKRFSNWTGSSSGCWAIQELTGLYLENQEPKGWRLRCIYDHKIFNYDTYEAMQQANPDLQMPGSDSILKREEFGPRSIEDADKAWGQNYTPNTELYLSLPRSLNGRQAHYKTRTALIEQIEIALTETPEPVLGELL